MDRFEVSANEIRWIDIVASSADEVKSVGQEFGLHPQAVTDCFEHGHLPKYERFPEVDFLIVRSFFEETAGKWCSIESLSRKVAIFVGQKFVLTVRTKSHPLFDELRSRGDLIIKDGRGRFLAYLLTKISNTYRVPLESYADQLEEMEFSTLGEGRDIKSLKLKNVYRLKRTLTMMKRLLHMNHDPINEIGESFEGADAPYFRNAEEHSVSLLQRADDLVEGLSHLISINISLASHRTNEASQKTNDIMRILTVISVIFMPLNFIVGIYGMNFHSIPELSWRYGYFYALSLLATVGLSIAWYFKKRRWF